MTNQVRTNLEREKYIRQEFLICYDKLNECLKHLANIRRMIPGTWYSADIFAHVVVRQHWVLHDIIDKLTEVAEGCHLINVKSRKGED